MTYYKKKKIELKNSTLYIQLDLSEIKEGNYIIKPKTDFVSLLKGEKEVAIITSYNNYRKYTQRNPIFIAEVDFKILHKTLSVESRMSKMLVV